jgi:tRNA dimethylallyltransferase
VTGPTGVGKSAFAVALAESLPAEIVGADAFQIYAGLPILTAQPTPDHLSTVPHHLIGLLPLDAHCDAAQYLALATEAIASIQDRGRIPILTGGTGLYLKALTHGLATLPPPPPELRQEIAAMDLPTALARLVESDPAAPAQIDIKNPVRIRRALEIVLTTARPLAESRTAWKSAPADFAGIVLERERDDLRARITSHVATMFKQGVVEEVRQAEKAGPGAARAIGFHEIRNLLEGKISEAACREQIVTATHRYAKRQVTWCRNQFTFPPLPLTPSTSLEESLTAARRLLGL